MRTFLDSADLAREKSEPGEGRIAEPVDGFDPVDTHHARATTCQIIFDNSTVDINVSVSPGGTRDGRFLPHRIR
ncbi:hypothetical protein GCM10011504_37590 [Siccirubricoccus deserti]|uniref:Uncharacterized protein n=1 Tax=Siccirubricoccus deserti TaxID=2013562 RepID=A0A9X0UDU0_9PROT|nr:hypothetical protein [Siccirubricoccus deserti]MBC4016974.1 hypothetical protein [Siccirubricoccus deserti]GGC55724.1 hypothetical protein GCM10011504_37590 [Siccirubricoccus deserti]